MARKKVSAAGIILLIGLLGSFYGCKNRSQTSSPQWSEQSIETGDLLFQDIDCGPLCEAIERVTQSIRGVHFSHVGIAQWKNDNLYVLEASQGSVHYTPFDKFLNRSLDSLGNPKVAVARLDTVQQQLMIDALQHAPEFLGKPYDDFFLPDNDRYYCSELVYALLEKEDSHQQVFVLEPMTYKDPQTGDIFPVWADYFARMKMEVPEGLPGLNPGGMSRMPHLQFLHWYWQPEAWSEANNE
ncbi:MAG: YiiX/YebB-like N1pC/P60 family cysteine hydrolase [Bacteroidota bacterium]